MVRFPLIEPQRHLITATLPHCSTTRDVRVLDVRWSLGGPPGRAAVPRRAHSRCGIRGSGNRTGRYTGPDRRPASAAGGGGPAGCGARWGINAGDTVVVYDDLGGLSAARAWWLLRYAGVETCVCSTARFPRGGLPGYPLSTGDEPAARGHHRAELRAPAGAVDGRGRRPARHGVLLDARAPERFRGESSRSIRGPVTSRAPAAPRHPGTSDADGRFLPADATGGTLRRARCAAGCRSRRVLRLRRHRRARRAGADDRRVHACRVSRVMVAVVEPSRAPCRDWGLHGGVSKIVAETVRWRQIPVPRWSRLPIRLSQRCGVVCTRYGDSTSYVRRTRHYFAVSTHFSRMLSRTRISPRPALARLFVTLHPPKR